MRDAVMDIVRGQFRPEFIDRVDGGDGGLAFSSPKAESAALD